MTRLLTRRLALRPLERADLDDLARLYADIELMRYIGDGHPADRAETKIWLRGNIDQAARDGYGLMATELRATGEFIGRSGFKRWTIDGEPMVEIGWMIERKSQGRGLATEAGAALRDHALGSLALEFVISLVHPANVASIRVAEKLGGTYRRDWLTPARNPVRVYRFE